MDVHRTTARLRRTFQYPADDDDDDDDAAGDMPEAMDEEEQDSLIRTLAAQNAARNAQFRRLLLALPLLAAVPYLLALAWRRPPASASRLLPPVLALHSLASTAYLVYAQPPARTGILLLDARGARGPPPPPAPELPGGAAAGSPLRRHLPLLNLGLCAVLALAGLLGGGGAADEPGRLLPGAVASCLPAAVYGVVLLAKTVMAGVDPEAELGGLRYEYKGA